MLLQIKSALLLLLFDILPKFFALTRICFYFVSYSFQTPEERKEEQRKYGVYFDDDYDYLKHLMPVGGPQGGYELEPVVQQNVEKDNEMLEAGSSEKPKIKPSSRPKVCSFLSQFTNTTS